MLLKTSLTLTAVMAALAGPALPGMFQDDVLATSSVAPATDVPAEAPRQDDKLEA